MYCLSFLMQLFSNSSKLTSVIQGRQMPMTLLVGDCGFLSLVQINYRFGKIGVLSL